MTIRFEDSSFGLFQNQYPHFLHYVQEFLIHFYSFYIEISIFKLSDMR